MLRRNHHALITQPVHEELADVQAHLAKLGQQAEQLPHEVAEEVACLARGLNKQLTSVERRLEGSVRHHPGVWVGAIALGSVLVASLFVRQR